MNPQHNIILICLSYNNPQRQNTRCGYTGCPTILFPLCFWLFLSLLIRYRNGFIVLSTALSMLVMKHTFILFLDEILRRIFAKQCRQDKFKTNILLQKYSITIRETLRENSPKDKTNTTVCVLLVLNEPWDIIQDILMKYNLFGFAKNN